MDSSQLSHSSTLASLPTEILSLALQGFCLHCREPQETPRSFLVRKEKDSRSWHSSDLQTLSSICLVSRRLCHIAQRILHHEFVPGYDNPWRVIDYFWDWRLNRFLRTVSERRDLGLLVKRLYLPFYLLSKDEEKIEAILKEAAEARGIDLSSFLAPFRASRPNQDNERYSPGGDELAGILLSCLPNLTWLAFSPGPSDRTIPLLSLNTAGLSNLPIRTLEIVATNSDLRHRLGGIYEISSGSISNLHLTNCCGQGIKSLDLFLPRLKDICIVGGNDVTGSDLGLLLSRCECLETFVYEAVSSDDYIPPSDIVRHLGKHKHTLKTLQLDLVKAHIVNGAFLPEPITTLNSFPVLQDLFLNSVFLFNSPVEIPEDKNTLSQLLPSSIVSLRLANNADTVGLPRLAKALLRLVETTSQGWFPKLKRIRCDTGERLDNGGVAEKLVEIGVDFGYDTWAFSSMRRRR